MREIEGFRDAITSNDWDRANEYLYSSWKSNVSVSELTELLLCLHENEEGIDTMFGIIHVVENALPADYYRALVNAIPFVETKAPSLAATLIGRVLASRLSQGRGFDANDFLNEVAKAENDRASEAIKAIVQRLRKDGMDLSEVKDRLPR